MCSIFGVDETYNRVYSEPPCGLAGAPEPIPLTCQSVFFRSMSPQVCTPRHVTNKTEHASQNMPRLTQTTCQQCKLSRQWNRMRPYVLSTRSRNRDFAFTSARCVCVRVCVDSNVCPYGRKRRAFWQLAGDSKSGSLKLQPQQLPLRASLQPHQLPENVRGSGLIDKRPAWHRIFLSQSRRSNSRRAAFQGACRWEGSSALM